MFCSVDQNIPQNSRNKVAHTWSFIHWMAGKRKLWKLYVCIMWIWYNCMQSMRTRVCLYRSTTFPFESVEFLVHTQNNSYINGTVVAQSTSCDHLIRSTLWINFQVRVWVYVCACVCGNVGPLSGMRLVELKKTKSNPISHAWVCTTKCARKHI